MSHVPTNRGPRVYGGQPSDDDVCRCDDDLLDEDLDELDDDAFEDEPCSRCGRHVLLGPPPVWKVEEEDDC